MPYWPLLSQFHCQCRCVSAYSGLDPRPNDSGTRRGRRLSKKGPAFLREANVPGGLSGQCSKGPRALVPGDPRQGLCLHKRPS
ncbi:MAG: transposase [Burkholderiaceae bacterium]|nr:transposase [Burkholderiaceae bacterium]